MDLKREWNHLYGTRGLDPVRVEVPAFTYLMVDGAGDPNRVPEYAEAVEALFSLSYAVKFSLKKGPRALDYAVMPLEGLWWSEDAEAFILGRRDDWRWTAMVLQPPFVARETLETVRVEVAQKKLLPGLARLRIETFEEGPCAQVLHVGPFSEEGPAIARLHRFIEGIGSLRGKHHEIYLSDIRRGDPSQWRTILRQPFT